MPLPEYHFGRQVGLRSAIRNPEHLGMVRPTEIRQLCRIPLVDEYVTGFDVAVDDGGLLFVQVFDGVYDVADH